MLGPSQRSLRAQALQLRDRRLPTASLFPLFDARGRVRGVMVTEQHHSRIAIASWRSGLFRWRPLGTNRLDVSSTELRDVEPSDWALEELWHFDPWWELAEPRYTSHPAAPHLRLTNLPGYAAALRSVWFDAQLRRVLWMATGSGESPSLRRFAPPFLAKAREERRRRPVEPSPPSGKAPGWRLNPFWRTDRDRCFGRPFRIGRP